MMVNLIGLLNSFGREVLFRILFSTSDKEFLIKRAQFQNPLFPLNINTLRKRITRS